MSENRDLFALFIDGDNIKPELVPQILGKINEYGNPIIKKVYLNNSATTRWQDIINEYSIHPIWVPNNTKGKNASDIALVIDAMELLCNRPDLKGFCIVSSDSDFTRLAKHIVEKNKFMLGIGEEKTPKSFERACSKFVRIEDLLQPPVPVEQPKSISGQEENTDAEIDQTFESLFIQAYENIPRDRDGWVKLIEIKEGMNALNSEFRSSNYQNMRRLAEEIKELAEFYPFGIIEIDEKLDSKPVIHSIRIDYDAFKFIEAYKQAPVRERDGWVLLSIIGDRLKKHPAYQNGFSYRGIRKNQLSKVVSEMVKDYPKTIEIHEANDGKSVIYLVRVND